MPSSAQTTASEKPHEEYQYLNALKEILDTTTLYENRTGVKTLMRFGTQMRFDLSNETLPLLTTKKMAIKSILKEVLWFLRGDTNGQHLLDEGVRIWEANGCRQFLDSRGLHHYKEHDLGPVYGFQWRHFGAEYRGCDADYTGQGVDQLANAIQAIKTNPTDRRIIVSAWNPCDLNKMALPPCHMMYHFNVEGEYLDCLMYQRSCDMGLGIPFNIASYSIMVHIIAKICGLKARHFVHTLGNYHIYEDHIEPLQEQISRQPYPFPQLKIKDRGQQKVEDFVFEDFEIVNYQSHGLIKMKMSA